MNICAPLIWLTIIFSVSSCAYSSNNCGADGLSFIEIKSAEGWDLTVFKDGSAYLHCRIKGLTQVCLPPESLSFQDLQLEINDCRRHNYGEYHINIHDLENAHAFHLFAEDSTKMAKWFEKAFVELENTASQRSSLRKLKRKWIEQAPKGVSFAVN